MKSALLAYSQYFLNKVVKNAADTSMTNKYNMQTVNKHEGISYNE